MSYSFARGPNVVVASGSANSPAMVADWSISDAEQISVLSPATLPETANIEISLDFNTEYLAEGITLAVATAAATWETEDSLGLAGAKVDILMSALGAFRAWRIHLNGNAAADRTFNIMRRVLTPSIGII